MGFKIFAHAMRLVFGNLGDALRISGVLYLLGAGLSTTAALAIPLSPSRWLPLLIVNIVASVLYIWVATAWHRFVLLDEHPDALLPAFNGRRVLVYVGYSLLVSLALAAIGLVGGIFVGIFAAAHVWIIVVPVAIIAVLVVFVVSYRLSVVLPAASVEKPIKLRDAWEDTRGSTWVMISIALLTFVSLAVVSLISRAVLAIGGLPLVELWSAIAGWVVLMVGVALITTLYGFYVDGRPVAGRSARSKPSSL